MRTAYLLCLASLFFLVLGTGCQPGLPAAQPTIAAATQTATSAPTSIVAGNNIVNEAPTVVPVKNASQRNEPPARFFFPTPGPIPSSGWRPPLYPAPWALSAYDHFYFVRPIGADEVNWPEPDYRYGGTYAESDTVHSGIDIDAPLGTPILAAGAGRVIWAGYGLLHNDKDVNDPYGKAVAILHDFGYNGLRLSTVYGHMDRIDVSVGQHVEAGSELGIVGLTGNTTGPHVHFEVRFQHGDYFTSRNPELWLVPPQGWGVLVGRLIREDASPMYQTLVYVRNKETDQIWQVKTYGPKNVRSDDYYRENLVLSDLPAGAYEVTWTYDDVDYRADVTIYPGASSYLYFRRGQPVSTEMPPTPSPDEWLYTPTPEKR